MLKFYTDVMGVSAAIVGTIMMLARFVDAFTDVAMGRIADNGKPTAAGKFKPWLKRMCIPVTAASFLIYAPGFLSGHWPDRSRQGRYFPYLYPGPRRGLYPAGCGTVVLVSPAQEAG